MRYLSVRIFLRFSVVLAGGLLVAALPSGATAGTSTGETIVAVSANFSVPARELAGIFQEETGLQVVLVFGSTGKHYAQIKNGAPFAAFLAADVERPRLLIAEGHALPGTRFTYATGRLVLWSPDADLVDDRGAILGSDHFRHLALANPDLAPYGRAAVEALGNLDLLAAVRSRLVRGENISQVFQYVASGSAELGFVALSQFRSLGPGDRGSWWLVPAELHEPIRQQAILLREDPVARAFLEFLKSARAHEVILRYGYNVDE